MSNEFANTSTNATTFSATNTCANANAITIDATTDAR